MPEIYIMLNDQNKYRLNYTEWGSKTAKNTLLCVHGLTRNGRDFDYLAKELSEHHDYHVICPDMPGRGKSEFLSDYKLYNQENYCLAILALLKHLDLKKVDYLGTSMGGLLAMHLNLIKPNLFNKLILNDIGIFLPKEALSLIAKYIKIYPSFRDYNHAKEYLKIKLVNFGIKSEDDWDYITMHSTYLNERDELVLNYDPNIANNSILPEDEIQDIDYSNFWPSLNPNKLLLLRGKNSDIFLYKTAVEMLESKNNSTLIEFKDTGHAPALMDNQQLSQVINWIIK